MATAREVAEKMRKKKEEEKSNTPSMSARQVAERIKTYNSFPIDSVNEEYINTFISDANNFIKGAEKDYSSIGWSNASSVYDTKNSTYQDLSTRQKAIEGWLIFNKSKIDEKNYNSLFESLSNINNNTTSIVNSFKNAKEIATQFETEEAYNSWYEEYKKKEAEKQAILGAEDFKHYSQIGANIKNPDSMQDASDSGVSFAGHLLIGKKGEEIGNVVTMSREHFVEIGLAEANGAGRDMAEMGLKHIYRYMTDEEVSIYNYYLGKGDKAKADEYLASIEDTLNQRHGNAMVEGIDGNEFISMVFAAMAGLNQFAYGIGNIDNLIMGTESDPLSSLQYAAPGIRENLDGAWKVGYDLVQTTTNMLPSILVGSVTGGIGGAVTMGASAVGNGYAEMRRLGYSANQARAYGLLVGASEAALQYALGGVGKLGGKVSGNAVSKFVSKFDNAIARTAIKIGGNMVSEGLEESLQSVLEPVFKSITTGEEFEGIDWEEVVYSGLLGALSAGILESSGTVASEINTYKEGKNIKGDADALERLTKLGSTMSADSVAYKLAGKIDENTGAYTIGRLLNEVGASLSEQNISDIVKSLEQKNIPSKDAQTIAKWLNKAVEGKYFNKKQIAALENNEYISQTFADVIVNQNSTVWQRINGYNELRKLAETQVSPSKATSTQTEANTVTEASPEEKKATESKFEASEKGKAKIGDAEVSIKEIASIKDGEVLLRLEDGSTVNENDIEYSSSAQEELYGYASSMSLNAATANAFINGYDGSISVEEYSLGFQEAYRYGEYGFPTQEMSQDGFSARLSKSQKELAYGLGKTDAKYKIDKNQSEKEKITSTVTKNADKNATQTEKKGKVHYEGSTDGLTERQKVSLQGLETLADALGIEFHIFESEVGEDGKHKGANGWFDPKDNSIHLDLYAGLTGESTILFTAAHELTHFIREWSPAKFKVLADFLFEQYGKKGVSVSELVNKQIEKAKRNGRSISYDVAYEEVVADSMETMLADGDVINKIAELKARDKSLWQKIKDFITELVTKIKKAYEGLAPDSMEGKHVAEMLDSAEQLKKLWTEALVDAGNTYNAIDKSLMANGIAVNSKTDSASLFSVRYLLDSKQQKTVVEQLATRFGVTVQEAKGWIDAETSLSSLILNPKYSQYLDYVADADEEAIKSNSDYPQGTVDFSNICKKRRDFTEVMNRLLRNFPNHVFEATDLAKIRTIMSEEGMEVACGICYVEDRRQLDSIVAQNFIDSLALYRNGSKTKPDGTPFNANQLKALKLIDGDTYTPSIYELISLEGRNSLKAKNPAMEAAWVKFNNARGMQSVRLLLNDAEYKRQILKYSPSVVKRKNDLGGLRIYSFSDMEMFHLIDIIQVITDSATVGLSLQGYTKVNEYARAVKDTGEKLNRSLIPKGDLGYHMEDGKVVLEYDTVEGIDINHPDFFDNIDNPNVGNIVIGINATQIKAAMTSKFIDQIIPFHTGQSGEVLGEKGIDTWVNYKDFQSERDVKTNKKSPHQINIYTEVINAAEAEGHPITNKVEFVNKFLEVCKENGLIPRFSDFLNVDENGDFVYTEGYHKFLVDFKTFDQNTGEYLPQMPVKPMFDNEYLTKLLKDYVKTQKVKDAKFAENMPKVLDRITKEIVKPSNEAKYSDRDSLGNELSKEQQEFFKDSKVRDKKGNLMVLYHGTTANFNIFKRGDVGFHFGTKGAARGRVGFGKNVTIKEVYLNITNPLVFDEDLGSWDADYRLTRELYDKGILTQADAESVLFTDDRMYKRTTEASNKKLASVLLEKGYDGIAYSNTFETKKATTSYIVFNSNQAKEITNRTPTSNPDIRYSLRGTNKDGIEVYETSEETKKLSYKERMEAFKTIMEEEYKGRTAKFTRNGHTYYALFDSQDVDKNIYGDKRSSSKGWKAKVNVGADGDIFELVENAKYDGSKAEKGKKIASHRSVGYWDYFIKTVQIDGTVFDLIANVRKKPNDSFVYSIQLNENKKIEASPSLGSPNGVLNRMLNASDKSISQDSDSVKKKFSDRSSYAPTFYSQMGKVIDEIKMDKISASSVVNYLKGKGIKNDEIKWSGIEYWLEGKKSVTKAELQEFVAGSQLVIDEEMSGEDLDLRYDAKSRAYTLYENGEVIDTFTYNKFMGGYVADSDEEIYSNEFEIRDAVRDVYGKASTPRWSDYKLNGGTNYRELVFKMPKSSYSNQAMRTHWGGDAEGVLAHARIQDMTTSDGKKMLFIEEIQSDWHNEGAKNGYDDDELFDRQKTLKRKAHEIFLKLEDYSVAATGLAGEWETIERTPRGAKLLSEYREIQEELKKADEAYMRAIPDAPFRTTYHEYVLKRLIRMAAEEGYDSIGWTPADIQSKRWSDEFAEGYRIEYDQDIPKFLRKYGKKWGATVGTDYVNPVNDKDRLIAEYERDIADYNRQIEEILAVVGEMGIDTIADEQIKFLTEGIEELQTGMKALNGTKIWSMDITNSMKDSVLYEGQVMYSDRDPDSVSNRSLLANALESVAQTDIERNKLKEYKSKISRIEEEQAKLAELRAKIKELSFAKGARDTKTIKSLQFEANQAANRINTYDRQLLNLESTKALKGVLEREKEMARKREAQKGKEALAAYKEKAAKTQRELMNRNQESRKKAIDSRHRTEMRHKIHKIVSELNQLLLNPTKEKHVPIGLQKPVAEALAVINMDTVGAEERIAKYDALIAKATDPDKIKALKKSRDNIELQGESLKDRLEALKNAYAAFEKSDDPLIRNAHNEAIENLIENTADKIGNTPLRSMSYEQLESVYDMFKAIRATVRNANKMFKEGRQETVSENSSNVTEEIRQIGGHRNRELKALKAFKKYGWNMFKPITAMKVIGSNTFEKLFSNVRAGEDTWAVDVSEAKEFFRDKAKRYNYWSWDFKKQYSFKDGTNRDFSLSLEQIMSLYAYSKRSQADKHLEIGGFVFDDAIEVTEKKYGIPLKYTVNDANPYRLTKEGIAEVISALTNEQKQFLDDMQTYLSDVMGAKGNEISLAMYDIKLYNEKNYFPLKTARYFREFNAEQSATPNLKNSGFSKKTVPQAGNPIVLSNFMDVWSSHVNDMSMYHAFVLPLEDFMRVYNYSSTAGGYDSVQQYIKNAYGSQANTYIETLLKDLNGGARVDPSADLVNKGISLFKKASVFASASVVVQQPSAMARAFAYIDPKYFATNPHIIDHNAEWAELKKYAPITIIKEMGYFDTSVGKKTTDWITERKYEGIAQKSKAVFTDSGYRDEILSKAPAMADELSWTYIWEAVKKETKATTKLEGEELLKQAGRRFTEVITNTQVYDSVLSRSAMMRSKDTGMKMATAFMAEPTTVVNMMVDGIIQSKRGNKKFLASTVGAVSASIILNSILVSLVYAGRDDDEDETYPEKYIESLTSELIDGFNPITYLPFAKDIWSIAQGYDVERSDMSVWSKLVESIESLFSEKKSGWEKTEEVVGAISSLFGLPFKNLLRDARGIYNLASTLLNGTKTTSQGISDAIKDSAKSSVPFWNRIEKLVGADESKSDKLYETIMSGDQTHINRVKAQYATEQALTSAIRTALRENDTRIHEAAQARYNGDIATYKQIAKAIIEEGRFSQDDVVAAINAEMNAIKKGETSAEDQSDDTTEEATSIYKASDINAAFDNGDNAIALEIINDLISTKVANGMDEKKAKSSVRSSMTSYWKPLYKEAWQNGDANEMKRIRYILFNSGLYGNGNEVVKTVQDWLKD